MHSLWFSHEMVTICFIFSFLSTYYKLSAYKLGIKEETMALDTRATDLCMNIRELEYRRIEFFSHDSIH